ncbi:hypothetical protein [Candidatus Marithrix sp. Canyon 246]|uniref:hypothetical protein n=1 Tax=Candidatus Marithrix sp. Canyon 246 TaxID=1827136 RepID=UPI00114D38AF|nr:hypothetical protein [Candidatus Marithrix sp. Canyon 246]
MNNIYLILKFDDRYLLVPQSDIELVETISTFTQYGLEAMVFNLNKDLLIQNSNQCKFIVLFKSTMVALLCEEVEKIKIDETEIQELSPVMRLSKSPITHLVTYKDQIACVCKGKTLVKYLLKL